MFRRILFAGLVVLLLAGTSSLPIARAQRPPLPSVPQGDPFFGIVSRDGAMIMLKSVGVAPVPNYTRDSAARWDAYVNVPDPDALATEYLSRGVQFSESLKDTHDGLRGFELKDADGYVLFFGRPRS